MNIDCNFLSTLFCLFPVDASIQMTLLLHVSVFIWCHAGHLFKYIEKILTAVKTNAAGNLSDGESGIRKERHRLFDAQLLEI